MTGEGAPFSIYAAEADPQDVVDYDYLLDTYGIGPHEADAVVGFGNYTGTLASALTDERCPVGGMIASAYQTGGHEAVDAKLGMLKMMDEKFDVRIGDDTRAYHEGAVDRQSLLTRPEPEAPGFLV